MSTAASAMRLSWLGGRKRVGPGEHDLVHRLVHDEPGELIGGQVLVVQAVQEPAVGR